MKQIFLLAFLSIGIAATAQHIGFDHVEHNAAPANLLTARFYDNQTITFAGIDSSIYFIDLNTLEIEKRINGLKGKVDAFSFSNDKKWMIASSIDNEVKTFKLRSAKVKSELGNYSPGYISSKSIRFSPFKSRFSVYRNCDILIGKKFKQKFLDSIPPLPDECAYNIEFFDEGHKFYASGNSFVWIYDLDKKAIVQKAKIGSTTVFNDMALSPDQQTLAVAGRDGMWLLNKDLSIRYELKGHTDWINDITFSPDGQLLYSCSGSCFGTDRTIRVWDISSGECLKVIDSHINDVHSIDISPNGRFLLSASRDKSLKIWDASTFELICAIFPVKKGNNRGLIYYSDRGHFFATDEIRDQIDFAFDSEHQPIHEIYNEEDMESLKKALLDLF